MTDFSRLHTGYTPPGQHERPTYLAVYHVTVD